MIMVTHDIFEAIEMGDKIALMNKGEIQQLGTPKELIFQPQNAFVKDFFDAQRFELSLKVSTLQDITPYLSNEANISTSCEVMRFSEKTNLLSILEVTSKIISDCVYIQILDKTKQLIKTSQRKHLLTAFYQMTARYQSNLS